MKLKQIFISLLFAMVALTSMSYATEHEMASSHGAEEQAEKSTYTPKSVSELAASFWQTTGINAIFDVNDGETTSEPAGHEYERDDMV